MTDNEMIIARLDKLYRDMPLEYAGYVLTAIHDIETIIHYNPYNIGRDLYRQGKGVSDLWSAVKSDSDMDEAMKGYTDAKLLYSMECGAELMSDKGYKESSLKSPQFLESQARYQSLFDSWSKDRK